MAMMDNNAGDDEGMMMMMDEESPPFREARHQIRNNAATPMMVPTVLKPADALSRDESSSSTTASTIATSESPATGAYNNNHSSSSNISGGEGICQVKEFGSDGDWLQQLQRRLYSREEEEAILLRTYLHSRRHSSINRKKSSSSPGELCLISGAAGLGKTRLARTLEAPVKEDGGYFLSSKFDQVKQARPIRIFADAFTEFTHMVLAQGPEVADTIRREIREALGDELPVLLSGVPVLEKLVGKANGEPVQMSCKMAKRFVFALQDLVSAICNRDSPMVLLFDDLQWADPCSLKLLKAFISCNQNRHLFILGTCDDSVGPCSNISSMLRDLEDESDRKISNVEVAQKPCRAMRDIITDAIPMPEDRHDVLAKLVCGQTQGNPLYILEFLRWLSDERLLQYDAAEGTWTVHDEEVRNSINPSCLGGFLVDKLKKLPGDVREVIKVAACFGNDINEELMNAVFPADFVGDRLHEATSRGVFVYDEEFGYSFRHDGLQKAALSLIPSEEKEALHLELGRKLSEGLTEEQREKHTYMIMGQLRLGKALIKDPREREGVAHLCLQAGQSSARSSAFGAAAGYMELGIELLDDSWEGDYSLKLALYNAAAEMLLTTSEYERVHELLNVVFDNVTSLKHKMQAYNTLILAYGVTDQQHLAVETGIKVLAELGETFPSRNCMAKLRGEMRKVSSLLRGKSNAQILRMEIVKNEEKVAALQLLNLMLMNAVLVKPGFAPFIQLKAVEITMRYGLSALSSVAFASYGMLCSAIGKYDDAFRYGQLSLDLLKKFRSKEYLPRVFAAVYGCIIPWQRPIQETIEPLKKAQQIGSQTGDIEFACMNASIYASAVFFTNAKLPVVSNQIGDIINMMTSRRQGSMLVLLKPFYQLTRNLMGLTDDPLTLSGDILEVEDATEHAKETQNVAALVCIRLQKMMLCYLFGDYEGAARMAAEIESIAFPAPGIEFMFMKFFVGMTHLAMARIYKGIQKQKCLNKAKQAIKQFKTWSLHSPHNCLAMKFLLEAELASFQGKTKKAYEKYTASTALAVNAGFRMVEAMTHEHCGRHLYSIGDEILAAASFRAAISCYQDWGAKAMVSHLNTRCKTGTSVQF